VVSAPWPRQSIKTTGRQKNKGGKRSRPRSAKSGQSNRSKGGIVNVFRTGEMGPNEMNGSIRMKEFESVVNIKGKKSKRRTLNRSKSSRGSKLRKLASNETYSKS